MIENILVILWRHLEYYITEKKGYSKKPFIKEFLMEEEEISPSIYNCNELKKNMDSALQSQIYIGKPESIYSYLLQLNEKVKFFFL